MPADQAKTLAGVITFAVFFGAAWANHTRAQIDLEGAKAGLEKAKKAAGRAGLTFAAAVAVAYVLARMYINRNGG